MSSKKVLKAIKTIHMDVMMSGYWLILCEDIEKIWEMCDPNSE